MDHSMGKLGLGHMDYRHGARDMARLEASLWASLLVQSIDQPDPPHGTVLGAFVVGMAG